MINVPLLISNLYVTNVNSIVDREITLNSMKTLIILLVKLIQSGWDVKIQLNTFIDAALLCLAVYYCLNKLNCYYTVFMALKTRFMLRGME